jgi:hypothetical protein
MYGESDSNATSSDFVFTGISSSPVTDIGQIEQNHRDLLPWIASSSLSVCRIIPPLGRPAIRNISQTTVTFHPHLKLSLALPRRASNTTRSALEGVGPKLFRSGEHRNRNPATRHGIAQSAIPCSANVLHRGLGTSRTHLRIDPMIGSLERVFNCSRHAIHSALANGLNEPKSRGRHFAVSAESDGNILASITGKAEKNAAVTRPDIKNYCRDVCKMEVTRGWVDSFISRHSAELMEKKCSRQEEPRLQVPRVFLDQTVRSMHEMVHGRPPDLVLNSI